MGFPSLKLITRTRTSLNKKCKGYRKTFITFKKQITLPEDSITHIRMVFPKAKIKLSGSGDCLIQHNKYDINAESIGYIKANANAGDLNINGAKKATLNSNKGTISVNNITETDSLVDLSNNKGITRVRNTRKADCRYNSGLQDNRLNVGEIDCRFNQKTGIQDNYPIQYKDSLVQRPAYYCSDNHGTQLIFGDSNRSSSADRNTGMQYKYWEQIWCDDSLEKLKKSLGLSWT